MRGSEVPGIAIPDFPVEEIGTAEPLPSDVAVPNAPSSEPSWPDLAPPGDMGYAIAKGDSAAPRARAVEDDDEPTGQHVVPPVSPPPAGGGGGPKR